MTGGGAGIGATIAEEVGRSGAFVVTVDPGVTLDGSTRLDATAEPTTADKIVAAGGQARASNTSVTDAAAVRTLFEGLVEEFGSLDAVVNVAGISRPSGSASGKEDDWTVVLDVHLNGYLNVLRAALPLMAEAGHGRILGVTSGSGWRAADAGAYSSRSGGRALTWQVGRAAPDGVSVNALLPIVATRMVLGAVARQAAEGNQSGRSAAVGRREPRARRRPPARVPRARRRYLASETIGVVHRTGDLLERRRGGMGAAAPPARYRAQADSPASRPWSTASTRSAFVSAQAAQATNGGGNPRLRGTYEGNGTRRPTARPPPWRTLPAGIRCRTGARRGRRRSRRAGSSVSSAGTVRRWLRNGRGTARRASCRSPHPSTPWSSCSCGRTPRRRARRLAADPRRARRHQDHIRRDATWIRVLAEHANDSASHSGSSPSPTPRRRGGGVRPGRCAAGPGPRTPRPRTGSTRS